MTKKTLSIIESAYRATLEEQDDTIVWITHAMKGAGADQTIVFRGNAVNYAVKGQTAKPLTFGNYVQKHPVNIENDVRSLMTKGIDVYVVEEDFAELGLERTDLIENVKTVNRAGVSKMFEQFERIWHW
jgi:sulfur relay (sulfurtransferase) DsrF/TusC family protein